MSTKALCLPAMVSGPAFLGAHAETSHSPEGGSPSWGVRHFDEGEEKGAWTTAAAGPHLPQGHSHVSVSGGFETGTDVFLDVLMDTRYLRNGGPVGTRICGPGH